MTERVVIVGAGIAGLCTALALGNSGRDLIILDRDPPPPDTSADEAFEKWERRGVGHLRHSHAFLARLYQLIRDNYPDLLQDLLAAGCRELKFADGLPATLQKKYTPLPSDQDLTILTSRRTTLELVMRRYVARQKSIQFITDTIIKSIETERTPDGALRIVKLIGERNRDPFEISGDIIVDAAGKNSQFIAWLEQAGATIPEESEGAGILYFTRHYRLNDGVNEPERGKIPGAGDLGYIKYGVFPADNRCFSITLAVPEIEMEMRKAIVHPDVFDNICAQLPGIATWTDPKTATPHSKVFGMGELLSRWRYMVPDGKPVAENFFPIGDTVIRTNPLYGRGCSFAAIQAQILRTTLDATSDPAQRAIVFHRDVAAEIRPYYDNMIKQDRTAIKRARNELDQTYRPSLRARLAKSFLDDGLTIAIRDDVSLMRAAMKGFHMLEHPTLWLKDIRVLSRIGYYWLRGKRRNASLYPPKLGPERTEMFHRLGLSATADIARLKAA